MGAPAPSRSRAAPWPSLLLLPLIAACTPVQALNATVPTAGVTITRSVAYGQDARQQLDIYQPATPRPGRPSVVFFYGGSWDSGRRGDYLFVAASLARRGVLVFVPDYRLYPQVQYPAFLRDCAQATVWAASHAAAYGGAADDLFLMGHSAGGYNAAMLTLDPQWLRGAGGSPAMLRGMIGLAGPYDFLPITGPEVKLVFGAAREDPSNQPINHVDGVNPPMLLLAGADDKTVYPKNAINLTRAVRARGGPAEDRIYPGIGHIGIVISIAPLFRWKDAAFADTLAFIDRQRPGT